MHSFQISEDIAHAETLPASFYQDATVFERAKDQIFAPSWQFLGSVDDLVKVPGAAHPLTLLEGCLDEPIVLTRDVADEIHCLSNVCTHRGMLVAEAPGNERFLRCRYHGRRFAMDGSFVSMPEFEGAENFPSPADNLPRLPLHKWGPLLFTGIDPAISSAAWWRSAGRCRRPTR